MLLICINSSQQPRHIYQECCLNIQAFGLKGAFWEDVEILRNWGKELARLLADYDKVKWGHEIGSKERMLLG